jgi:hypothetical protein
MRKYPFPLAAVFALLLAGLSQAAEKPRPAQANQTQPKKIWTNDDTDRLHTQGLISIVGQEVSETAAQTPAEPAEATFPVYESRLDDPTWYADQAADLQAELDRRQVALRQQQLAITQAVDHRVTDPGVALDKGSPGMTPAEGLANLQAQVEEIQNYLDELSDLARQHDIPPGVLRG